MLQPTITMLANTIQEARYARRVGNGNSAVVIVNVFRHAAAGGTVTFDIETASHTKLSAAGNTFWKSCVSGGGNTIGAGVVGAVKFKLADIGRFIRYNISNSGSWPGLGADFDITVFFADT